MQNILNYILLFIGLPFASIGQTSIYKEPVESPEEILLNQTNFLNYNNQYLKLSENFIALDTGLNIISKENFLINVSSGQFLPLKLKTIDSIYYKLYKIPAQTDSIINSVIRDIGVVEYKHFQMEGKELPKFDFIDLNGKVYNKETTTGKILVIKCWFIKCQRCVEELPALNKLVATYKKNKDVLFVSLAFDKESALAIFLKKRKFKYAVVPNMETYLMKDLSISLYPTHLIINKKGIIVKVVNSAEEMEIALKQEILK